MLGNHMNEGLTMDNKFCAYSFLLAYSQLDKAENRKIFIHRVVCVSKSIVFFLFVKFFLSKVLLHYE